MTNQQLADQLLAQWQILWPLPPAERIRLINEIAADLEYSQQLQLVEQEMEA